jgi:outer membrane protein, heavy metal efflux system
MGSKRSKSDFHWQLDRRLALATYALAACCFMLLASCTTSKSEIVKESPIRADQSGVIPAKAAGSGEIAPSCRSLDGNNTAVSQGDSTTVASTISSNSSNPIQFGTNSFLMQRDNLVPGTPKNPSVPTNSYATLAFSSPTIGSTQPIPTSLSGSDPATSRQVAWTSANAEELNPIEGGVRTEPEIGVGNAPVRLADLNQVSAGARQTVAGVIQYALEHHPALRVRQHEVEAARARMITARLLPNPELMMQTSSPTDTDGSTDLTTRLMFTIPIGPKRAWRTSAAQSDIFTAQKALSFETKIILAEAADAAIEVLYLQEQSSIYDQLVKLSDQVSIIQKESFKAAIVPYRNAVLSELSAYNLELERRTSASRLNQSKVRLARAMGIPDASPPHVEGQLAVELIALPQLSSVLDRAGQTSPELAQKCGAIQSSRQQHMLERWNALPDISLGPRVQNDLSGEPNNRLGARVQMDLPIFNRNQGNIAEKAAEIQINCATYDLVRVTTLNDVAALYNELQDTQSRAEFYKARIQPLTEQSEQAIETAFQDRTVTAYELTKLMETLSRLKLSDLELRYEHYRLRTRLELLLECPLSSFSEHEASPLPPESISMPIPQDIPAETQRQ